jgi:AraC-like DNA-binding protein
MAEKFDIKTVLKQLILLQIIWIVLSLLSSCNLQSSGKELPTALTKRTIYIQQELATFQRLIICCPDSAIAKAGQLAILLDSSHNPQNLITFYSSLAQAYQLRKGDNLNATIYLSKGAKLLAAHPELENANQNIFLNIGNTLLGYRLYERALSMYRNALYLARQKGSATGIPVIFNNIALAYQQEGRYDSARIYFDSATSNIIKKSDVEFAWHYMYIGNLLLDLGQNDSVPFYHSKTLEILNDFKGKKLFHGLIDSVISVQYFNEISANTFKTMGTWHARSNRYHSSLIFYQHALYYAQQSNTPLSVSNIYFLIAKIYSQASSTEQAVKYADSAIGISLHVKNYVLTEQYARFLMDAVKTGYRLVNARRYYEIAAAATDSLTHQESATNFAQGKIVLSEIEKEMAIQSLHEGGRALQKTIKVQIDMLGITGALLLITGIAITMLLFKNKQLRQIQKKLAVCTVEETRAETRSTSQAIDGATDLLFNLGKYLKEEKGYMNQNLNMNELCIQFQTNRTYLSQLINQNFGYNFHDYINSLRIKEACRIIHQNPDKNFTIDHLYSTVGFSSKSTFYSAFRKFTGVAPANYIKINEQLINEPDPEFTISSGV